MLSYCYSTPAGGGINALRVPEAYTLFITKKLEVETMPYQLDQHVNEATDFDLATGTIVAHRHGLWIPWWGLWLIPKGRHYCASLFSKSGRPCLASECLRCR